MPEISTKRLDLSKQAKKWVKKSLQNSNFRKLEESPYKVDHYFSQNPLAKSLCEKNYTNNPNFARKVKDHSLSFKAYGPDEFKRSAIDERQNLYLAMAEIVWSPEVLDQL